MCDKTLKNEIANKLKTLRKGRKMTQQELADKLNLNRSTISNYEVGRRVPHFPELESIAYFFGVGLDYFGVAPKDEVFDLLSRAKEVFESDKVNKVDKERLYKELMRIYLSIE